MANPIGGAAAARATLAATPTATALRLPRPRRVPAGAMPQIKFNVEMACGGCSGACTRILNKIEGVQNVNCDLDAQTVTVDAADGVDPQVLLAKLQGRSAGVPFFFMWRRARFFFFRARARRAPDPARPLARDRRLGREGEQEG